jgi:hypothetical protein
MATSTDKPDALASLDGPKNVNHIPHEKSNGIYTTGPELGSSPKPSIVKVEDLATKVLRFLSGASTEALGGIALGLVVCTYLVLGRVGLVLIGALGGIILHATWEGQSAPTGRAEEARKENGLEIVKRVLDWREERAPSRDNEEVDHGEQSTLPGRGFEDFHPETGAALAGFVEAVIRDYVRWWYSPIVPTDESFPAACRRTFIAFIRSISTHLARKRPADTFLDFLTNSSSIIIVFLGELSSALSVSHGIPMSPAEAVDDYLLTNPESNLANIINEKQQKKKFKMIAGDILENFLDRSAFDCNPMRIFLKEMLASVVMEMSLNKFSKADYINGWIVYLLEEGEPEFSQVIDAGMGNSTVVELSSANISSTKSFPTEEKKHRKRLSKAEEAMEEAMEEAKRLSQLIAEEDRQRLQGQEASESNRQGVESTNIARDAKILEEPLPTIRQRADKKESFEETAANIDASPTSNKTPTTAKVTTFTSFDQIVPPSQPTALQPDAQTNQGSLTPTLHNANIVVIDDPTPSDKGRIRTKPSGDYLVQIEPKLSGGWIVVRKYYDFETLHEGELLVILWKSSLIYTATNPGLSTVLRRIATISGVTAFAEQHSSLPDWKMHTKPSLRGELERYLRDACWHQQLAESEGMKRFLEKDQANMQSSGSKGIGWPTPAAFESMGKGMLDVLASAPKGAAEGGKAVFGGVTGVLGNIGSLGQKKRESVSNIGTQATGRSSTSTLPRLDSSYSINEPRCGVNSEESLRTPSPIINTQPAKTPPMERRPSYASIAENGTEAELDGPEKGRISLSSRSSISGQAGTSNTRSSSRAPSIAARVSSPTQIVDMENIVLPPLPSDIRDDYGSTAESSSLSHSRTESITATARTSTSTAPSLQSPSRSSTSVSTRPPLPIRPRKEVTPLTEQETRVAVELLFAMINELYTLSSVWNIRRTLLTAAKTFMLRPGNPSLASIQSLLQDSVIASNTSDAGIAAHLRKLRENTLPTEEELKAWPPEMTPDEKERLRLKARKLLVEKGMPAALTGVLGLVATGDALGKIFDCLQVEEVARGLMFGLLLQGIRAITH